MPHTCDAFTFEKSLGFLVPANFHLFNLNVLPLVHGDGADEAEMHAESAMLARALETDPYPVGDADPLRVQSAALEAAAVPVLRLQILQRLSCPWARHDLRRTELITTIL